jgi:hypothetical protein
MLADPQSVTINAVATSLAKTSPGPNQNVYTSADGNTTMTTKQNLTAKRFRREVRLSQKKLRQIRFRQLTLRQVLPSIL